MISEVDRVGLIVPEAMRASSVFSRLDPKQEEYYRLRLMGIVGLINEHFDRKWSQATDLKIEDLLRGNPGSDGRHPTEALAQDLIEGGFTKGAGARATVERVIKISVQMLSRNVYTLEELKLRQGAKKLGPGELPRGVKGGIRKPRFDKT